MTVVARENRSGILLQSQAEAKTETESVGYQIKFTEKTGLIHPDLSIGPNIVGAKKLNSNRGVCSVGYQLTGKGFVVSRNKRSHFIEANAKSADFLGRLVTGIQIQRTPKDEFAINVSSLSLMELKQYPHIYQHLLDSVKPIRDENSRKSVREKWWVYGEPRNTFTPALENINEIIVTSLTASNRIFAQYPASTIADSTTVMFAISSSYFACLSSKHHTLWAAEAGGRMGVGNDLRYNKSLCFDPFPFPDLAKNPKLHSTLFELGEILDRHRKDRQTEHPKLTQTQMYNVLEKVKSGDQIEGKDSLIYEQGLIGILKQIHDDIDAAVAEAYGWPTNLSNEEILQRLVDLNRERALEEAKGNIRWLRPEHQNPDGQSVKAQSGELKLEDASLPDAISWPKSLPEQMAAIKQALLDAGQADVENIRSQFKYAKTNTVKERLDTLAALGQAELLEDGRYAA